MTVFVTGANRGIGLALVKHFARAGRDVIGTYRGDKPAPLVGVEWARLDVSDPRSHADCAKRLNGRALELLVCNAGVYLEKGKALDDPNIWSDTFAVNVTGVYLTVHHLLPHVRGAKGKIAIISSNMGSDARAPGGSYVYRASKAAALNLGRNLAADLKSDGIAVGIYHPGWVVTDMGGSGAAISVDVSAAGLIENFARLSLANTGCFESYDGSTLAF